MSWFGYYAAKGFSDLVKGELSSTERGGEPYLLPDERMRQSACARLAAEPSLDCSGLEVRVLSGVLHLSGHVPDESTRARVASLCEETPGVTGFENALTVK
jgi:osmotically-inducible protein OsmY